MHGFKYNDFVFARVRGYPPWPARVKEVLQTKTIHGRYKVIFYGTYDYGYVSEKFLYPFSKEAMARNIVGKRFRKKYDMAIQHIQEDLTFVPDKEKMGGTSRKIKNNNVTRTFIKKTLCGRMPVIDLIRIDDLYPSLRKIVQMHAVQEKQNMIKSESSDTDCDVFDVLSDESNLESPSLTDIKSPITDLSDTESAYDNRWQYDATTMPAVCTERKLELEIDYDMNTLKKTEDLLSFDELINFYEAETDVDESDEDSNVNTERTPKSKKKRRINPWNKKSSCTCIMCTPVITKSKINQNLPHGPSENVSDCRTPKKRGRKRKSEIPPQDTSDEINKLSPRSCKAIKRTAPLKANPITNSTNEKALPTGTVVSPGKVYSCEYCHLRSSSSSYAKCHSRLCKTLYDKKKILKAAKPKDNGSLIFYPCEICSQVCFTMESFIKHTGYHNSESNIRQHSQNLLQDENELILRSLNENTVPTNIPDQGELKEKTSLIPDVTNTISDETSNSTISAEEGEHLNLEFNPPETVTSEINNAETFPNESETHIHTECVVDDDTVSVTECEGLERISPPQPALQESELPTVNKDINLSSSSNPFTICEQTNDSGFINEKTEFIMMDDLATDLKLTLQRSIDSGTRGNFQELPNSNLPPLQSACSSLPVRENFVPRPLIFLPDRPVAEDSVSKEHVEESERLPIRVDSVCTLAEQFNHESALNMSNVPNRSDDIGNAPNYLSGNHQIIHLPLERERPLKMLHFLPTVSTVNKPIRYLVFTNQNFPASISNQIFPTIIHSNSNLENSSLGAPLLINTSVEADSPVYTTTESSNLCNTEEIDLCATPEHQTQNHNNSSSKGEQYQGQVSNPPGKTFLRRISKVISAIENKNKISGLKSSSLHTNDINRILLRNSQMPVILRKTNKTLKLSRLLAGASGTENSSPTRVQTNLTVGNQECSRTPRKKRKSKPSETIMTATKDQGSNTEVQDTTVDDDCLIVDVRMPNDPLVLTSSQKRSKPRENRSNLQGGTYISSLHTKGESNRFVTISELASEIQSNQLNQNFEKENVSERSAPVECPVSTETDFVEEIQLCEKETEPCSTTKEISVLSKTNIFQENLNNETETPDLVSLASPKTTQPDPTELPSDLRCKEVINNLIEEIFKNPKREHTIPSGCTFSVISKRKVVEQSLVPAPDERSTECRVQDDSFSRDLRNEDSVASNEMLFQISDIKTITTECRVQDDSFSLDLRNEDSVASNEMLFQISGIKTITTTEFSHDEEKGKAAAQENTVCSIRKEIECIELD